MEASIKWVSGMTFRGEQDGHELFLDLPPDMGGQDRGAKPKTLLLTGLGGCTGMDVVSILAKMRVALDGFEVRLSADQTDEHPKVFTGIHIKYIFRGKDLPLDKVQKAVALSEERYCGVSAMLAKACPITRQIVLERS
jgi:putative redox protein